MTGALNGKKLFGLVSQCKELFSLGDADDLVVCPVDDQERAADAADFFVVREFIEGKNGDARHHAEGGKKRALQNQRRRGPARGQMHGRSASYGSSKDDD